MGRYLEDSDLGSIRDPGGRRRHPKYDQEIITTTHQTVGIGQCCGRRQAHEGVCGQVVVHRGPLGLGKYISTGLASQAGPLNLQVPPHIIQEGYKPQ